MARAKAGRAAGDVVCVPLNDGKVAFGWVLKRPLVAFFDLALADSRDVAIDDVVASRIAFRVWVMDKAVGSWSLVGHVDPPAEVLSPPWFFKKDAISGVLTKTRGGQEEWPATEAECQLLERAAVWSARHIVDRLTDHIAGLPSKWVKTLGV